MIFSWDKLFIVNMFSVLISKAQHENWAFSFCVQKKTQHSRSFKVVSGRYDVRCCTMNEIVGIHAAPQKVVARGSQPTC